LYDFDLVVLFLRAALVSGDKEHFIDGTSSFIPRVSIVPHVKGELFHGELFFLRQTLTKISLTMAMTKFIILMIMVIVKKKNRTQVHNSYSSVSTGSNVPRAAL